MKTYISFIFFALFFILTGCSNGESAPKQQENSLMIYTTVYPLQYLAEEIGGNKVEVQSVYPPGADEHTFEPSQKDMMEISDADLFYYIGYGLEGFVEKAKETLSTQEVTFVPIGEKLALHIKEEATEHEDEHSDEHTNEHADEHENEHHHSSDVDPHVWLDPQNMIELGEAVKDSLVQKLPAEADYFEENLSNVTEQLTNLDQDFKQTVDQSGRKEIIVAHEAYGYWEKRYGIKQISIAGKSTAAEPSQKELKALVELAKKYNINYVLVEQNGSTKLVETVQKEIGAKSLPLHNLSVLTSNDIKEKKDYISIMKENMETLSKALN